MSVVDSPIHSPVIPEGRRHSPDIIDVDALDTDDIVYMGSARPSQRRRVGEEGRASPVTREVTHVTDNEDDNEIQFIGYNPARPQPPLVRRDRIFSPPPPPQIGGVPPVPPIPHRFLSLRQHPPPGVIIPNEDPLPFEFDLRPPPPAEQPIPAAAATSHHVPSMGFGGALMAGVRRFMAPRTSQRLEHHNSWGVSGSFIMRWDPFDFDGGEEDELLDGLDEIGFLGEEDNPFTAGSVRGQIERAFSRRDRQVQVEPDYKLGYTHPDQPLPGFTHDFLPSSPSSVTEVDTPSTRQASGSGARLREVTLICAACRDPLVLGASDVGEGRAKRKLWGLRCGHLLDGKCIEKLMEPAPPTSDAAGSSSGRIPAEPPSSSLDTMVVDTNASSMRLRLRPRRGIAGSFPSPSHPVPATPSSGRRGSAARAQATHRNNRKGKGKMKAPVVEAEHEWNCPVSGCGRVHLSLFMDGRWTMDEKRGAITVFV